VTGGRFAFSRVNLGLGNVRTGLLTGVNERNSGRNPSSAAMVAADEVAAPRSNCSHANVRASPLPSLPVAVSANGVCLGIV
jgi:hypothetical protein